MGLGGGLTEHMPGNGWLGGCDTGSGLVGEEEGITRPVEWMLKASALIGVRAW